MILNIRLIIIFFLFSLLAKGQKNDSILGIWRNGTDTVNFKIFINNNYLSINYRNEGLKSFYVETFGYTNSNLQKSCLNFVKQYDELKNKYLCFGSDGLPSEIEFNDDKTSLVITNINEFYYSRVTQLPNRYLVYLKKQSQEDGRDYLEEFLGKRIELMVSKSAIYDSNFKMTKMYLIQNDPVEVIEEQGEWLRIKYYPEKNGEWTGKIIEGWIKKSDVE